MTGLREKQRQRRHTAILAAAAALFRSRGFGKTTMESIAEDAEVGIATVYNYFGSKEKILVELFRPCLERSYEEAETILRSLPAKPANGVLKILQCYRHLQEEWDDRPLLREFAAFGLNSEGQVQELIVETDRKLREQIRSIFGLYAKQGKISRRLDLDAATAIIFALFNQFYYQFLQSDSIPYGRILAEFERLVPALFIPWETDEALALPTGAAG